MGRGQNFGMTGLWAATLVLLGAALAMTVWHAPGDGQVDPVQRLFFIHLGTAIGTLLACALVFLGSVLYLWQRDLRWDALADAAGRAAVLMLTGVLATGMLWAKQAWGRWWEWSPPLTFSLVLWALCIGYLVNRRWGGTPDRRASRSAIFGVIASLDVPLVYLSLKFLPASHLSAGTHSPATRQTLLAWVVAVVLLTACLILTRYRLTRLCGPRGDGERAGAHGAAAVGGRV